MSVTWTRFANGQLAAIRDYVARSSPRYAQMLVARLLARSRTLDGQPFLGSEVPEYGDSEIRELYQQPYRLMYRVVGSDSQVIAVIHSAQQLPPDPPG